MDADSIRDNMNYSMALSSGRDTSNLMKSNKIGKSSFLGSIDENVEMKKQSQPNVLELNESQVNRRRSNTIQHQQGFDLNPPMPPNEFGIIANLPPPADILGKGLNAPAPPVFSDLDPPM